MQWTPRLGPYLQLYLGIIQISMHTIHPTEISQHRGLDGLTVTCAPLVKLLGVILDEEILWKQHAAYATGKGTKLFMAINRLTKPTYGLPHKHVR
jgi:hypothetical protein